MQIQELATTLREEFINDKSLKKKEANSLTDIEIISYANSCHGCGEKHVTEKQLNKIVNRCVTRRHFWAMLYSYSDHYINNDYWIQKEEN